MNFRIAPPKARRPNLSDSAPSNSTREKHPGLPTEDRGVKAG